MRRRIIFALVALVVIIGGGVAVLLLIDHSPALQNAVLKASNTNGTTNTANTNSPISAVNRPVVAPDREAILFVSRNFSERFGSGSNQNDGSNFIEAGAYTTPLFKNYLQSQAAQMQAAAAPTTYEGTITKALAFKVAKQSASSASVVVTTQQTITTGTASKTQNKDLSLELVKSGSDWKVNSAVWK